MARRMKRITALLLLCVMLVTTFSGCNKQAAEQSDSNSTQSESNSTQVASKDEEPVTIDWLSYMSVGQPDSNSEIVKQVEKRYNAKFNFWFVDNQKWDDTLNVKLAAGEVPDVMRLNTRSNLKKYVEQGFLGELPVETIRKMAPDYAKAIDKVDTEKLEWNLAKCDGKNYGFAFPSLDGTYPTSIVWRQDWLKNVGINKIPETLQEFEEALYKFRNNDPDKNGKKDTYGISNNGLQIAFGAFGHIPLQGFTGNPIPVMNWAKKDGKLVLAPIQPEMKEALALLQKWYKDGIIDPEFITGENKGGYWAISHAFINGRIGVTGSTMFYHNVPKLYEGAGRGVVLDEFAKVHPEADLDKTITLGKAPVGPKGKSGTESWGYWGETHLVSVKATQEPRKINTILKMVNDMFADEEYYMLIRNGIKDVDYKFDGKHVTSLNTDAVEGQKKGLGVFNFLSDNLDIQKKYTKELYDFADKYKGPAYPGYPVPSTDASSKYGSDIEKMSIEYYIKMITGEYSIDKFDEYVKKVNDNGGTELEKQTNEAWNKTIGN